MRKFAELKSALASHEAVSQTTEIVILVLIAIVIATVIGLALKTVLGDENSGIVAKIKALLDNWADAATEVPTV